MHLKTLLLHNFRNYSSERFTFAKGINIILGENAQGKTNLLEALYLLSTGKSFRSSLSELIKEKETFFRIDAEIEKETTHTISLTFDKKDRKLQIDATTYSSFMQLLGFFPSVYLSSEDHWILNAPLHRRRFLNFHLAQEDPSYVLHLSRYQRALKQRNCLLKKKDLNSLSPWEEEMARSAGYLFEKRNTCLTDYQNSLSSFKLYEPISLTYRPSLGFETTYLKSLEAARERDLLLSTTEIGPHRDNFFLKIQDKNAIDCSEGQKRMLLSLLRLSQLKLFEKHFQCSIPFLIDDFGMHLDPNRQKSLFDLLPTLDQVFITSPVPLAFKGTVFHIEKGKLTQ